MIFFFFWCHVIFSGSLFWSTSVMFRVLMTVRLHLSEIKNSLMMVERNESDGKKSEVNCTILKLALMHLRWSQTSLHTLNLLWLPSRIIWKRSNDSNALIKHINKQVTVSAVYKRIAGHLWSSRYIIKEKIWTHLEVGISLTERLHTSMKCFFVHIKTFESIWR